MKLVELILNYKYLYNFLDEQTETTRYAVSNSEIQKVTAKIRSNVEKRKKELSELREMSNQLFSALANNKIMVAGEELSLATALEQLGGFATIYGKEDDVSACRPNPFVPVGCCPSVSSYSTVTGLKHPQMRFLESFSKGYMCGWHFDDEDGILVDPYKTIEDSDYTKLIAYEKELKSAFIQAISNIDV